MPTLETFFNTPVVPLTEERQAKILAMNSVQIGAGNDVVYADRDGMWSGARQFADAEYSLPLTGQFIYRSTQTTANVDPFGNGTQVVNQVKVTNTAGKRLTAIIERAVYVNSVAAANLLPGGSAIDESQFQVIGNNFSLIDTAGAAVNDSQLVNHWYCRNISAGAVTLVIHVRVRYIVNQG